MTADIFYHGNVNRDPGEGCRGGWMSCLVIISANKELQEQDRGTRGLLTAQCSLCVD